MRWASFVAHQELIGVRFALNVFIASAILWFLLRDIEASNPIWAIASMVASSEPRVEEARRMFRSRIINVLVGCAIGLAFLSIGGSREWKLPLALAAAVLISAYVVRVQTMWRQAPITVAIILAAHLTHHSTLESIARGFHKVAEVLLGCVIGLMVSWLMSRIWPLPAPAPKTGT
jgi:uncharacterized membrane protein YccC